MESHINKEIEDFSAGPVAKTLLPMQETRVRSLVRKLCAATKSSGCCSQREKLFTTICATKYTCIYVYVHICVYIYI